MRLYVGDIARRAAAPIAALALAMTVYGCETPGRSGEYRADVPEAQNMRLVGYNDLQARSAYQPVINHQGSRYIAYIGHHGGSRVNPTNGRTEDNGTSIVDVTDPSKPRYLVHIPGEKGGPESGGAQMVRVCNGTDLPK